MELGFGVATSAYQVEGAVAADGRGPSVWDVFCAEPGRVVDGSDGRVACDSYHRLDEDLALLQGLGVSAYRFSIAWPRVQPTGSGPVNPRGLDYYERLVDALLAAGVRPFPTLFHWDLPQALQDAGGWPERDTALRFAEYAGVVHERLGDRVQAWATLNEPWCTAFLGYASGMFAPGRREPAAAFATAHHQLLGHALAAQALHAVDPRAEVGIVLNLAPVRPEPAADPAAVEVVEAIQNGLWLDALADGTYPAVLGDALAPAVRDGDLELVRGSADWVGVNYYVPIRVGPPAGAVVAVGQDVDAYPGAPPFSFWPRPPLTSMGWETDATGLEELLLEVARRLPGTPLRVTENGASFPDDVLAADGSVVDDDRIAYLEKHLAALDRAIAAGVPVLDYFAWSLMDNFEWAQGYTQTFGLVTVEPGSLRRTPKASYAWYAELVARRRQSDVSP